ncbi:MAG: 6-carboxytetrahydropterin synthase [Sedimentisphaerales bacterium]|nr:6-carboxytetrahydropterin synthase [Sedimentisphaerales bacterium]
MTITRGVKIYYRIRDGKLLTSQSGDNILDCLTLKLWLSFAGTVDVNSGLIVNVSLIKRAVAQRLTDNEVYCHCITDILNWVYTALADCFSTCQLVNAVLEIDDHAFARSLKEPEMLTITRKYELAAAHRLWNDKWDAQKNYVEFGKCANPNGHGHNYTLEVTVRCPARNNCPTQTDMDKIDNVVKELVLESFDHKNLCLDIPEMQNMVPTVENMAVVIWDILKDKFSPLTLHNIRIWETANTYADYNGNNS